MYRLVVFICLLSIHVAQAQEEWDLYLHIGGKGDSSRSTSSCHALSDLMNEIPFTDIEPNFKWAADNNKSLASELIAVGRIGDAEFIEIQQRIDDGYYDYVRIISIENDQGQLCPFYATIDNNHSVEMTTAYVFDSSILVDKSRVAGNGGYHVENYFYLENGVVAKLEIDAVLQGGVDAFLAENPEYVTSSRAGFFSLENLTYRIPVFDDPAACMACSVGTLDLVLGMEDYNLVVLSSEVNLR